MPAPSDFRLYHSNALEVLAGLLAEELRRPAPGQPLLAPEVVLIPQAAMRRWLQATLAQAHGIAANLEFLTPGEFVRRALDANVPGEAQDLDADALRWRLYDVLAQPAALRGDPALAPLRRYLDDGDALKPWSLAGEFASVFEKYQAWRRDWLLAWEAGQARRDAQAALWRRVAAGRLHRARRIDDYLARFGGADAPLPAGLPPRLFAFATLNVSPDVLRVIATQARAGTLHFYLPTPSRKYWGDVATLAERLRAGEDVAFGRDDNPLLQAWGAAGRDFVAVLGGYDVVHPAGEIAAYDDPEARADDAPARDTLLRRLQRDLLHRRAQPAQPFRAEVEAGDASLQVHACHTRLREVQVLHDRLRGLLEDPRFDPPLQPREIAVLAPDIDPYLPHVEAVFGGLAGRPDFIPYAVADASPLAAEPLADVFLRLLALPLSRFGLHEILDLLATPALAEQAALDAPSLARLRVWLQDAGARWALDAAQRARHGAPDDDAYTWRFALDRLLLGHASGDAADIAGVAPWPDLEGSGLDALDTLIRLLRVLARHERALGLALTPAQWRDRLFGLLDALLPRRPREAADQRALERLRDVLDAFAGSAARADVARPVPPEVVRAHLHAALSDVDARAPLLTGGVGFGRMVPMRLIPFRVIALLGMNDGDYPRRDPAAGLNRLAGELGTPARRRGDRSLRDDDRFLFLQLFASAADVFYLSYLGADPRDGALREPSTLVAELLDVAAAYHAEPAAARARLLVRQPLQPFAPAAFGADDARLYSYRDEWRPAAAWPPGQRVTPAPWLAAPLPALAGEDDLAVAELRQFLRDPAEGFLRQRLNLRLPRPAERLDDVDPLALPERGLRRWQLQQAVFAACVRASPPSPAALHAELRARAWLPSGPLGARQLAQVLDQVQPYAEAFRHWRGDAVAAARTVDLSLDGTRLHGRVDEVYAHGLPRLRFDRLHGPAQIAHGLDWLLLCAAGAGVPLLQFHGAGAPADLTPRAPIAADAARAALQALLRLRRHGLTEPLPFAPRAGYVWYDTFAATANDERAWDAARKGWHPERGYGEGDAAAVRLALRGRDPFADAALGEEFREIARIVFDAVVHGRDGDAA